MEIGQASINSLKSQGVHAYWTMAWGEALSGKISRLSLSELLFLLKIRMFIPFFAATQKDFALFLYLCGKLDKQETKRKNPIRRCI